MRIEDADDDSRLPVVALAKEYGHGTRVPPHAHRRAQLLYAVTGTLRVTTDAGAWIVPSLRAVWIPPGVEHGFLIAGDVSMRTLYVDAATAVFPDGGRCRVVAVSDLLRALILAACHERAGEDRARAALMSGLILSELARAPEVPLNLPMPRDRRLAALCRALLDDPARDDTLEGWADSCGACARTLARLFRRDTGLSFGVWRQQARLAEALARLAQGDSVAAAARAAGYGSPSAFTAMFRRALGETPQRYAEGVAGGRTVTARPFPPAGAGSSPPPPDGRTDAR
ncbi:AraC-like DNA-binding protein [Azospirillum fermentarium]|uniref:AraC family transcriptional regulator n=1 Tax=Azospirillum fermentarium TaxID=1233114 RepID=UPI002225D853|nr:helix-turn-helix transcriptional regulator [Azospirillum fermentarium]MCW2244803.1 AraC-like DNA-binding protein [Azospirillum fermentarium]